MYLSDNSVNFENMMRALEISGKRFGAVKHTSLQGIHNININHGMGENFSKFIASVHKKLADDLSYKFELANIDKNMVCMHISESKKS